MIPLSDQDAPLPPSKSQRKREMIQLQKIGEELVTLTLSQLEKIPLNPRLKDAIITAKTLKGHEAKRRQLQFIGKLMRDADGDAIQAALQKIQLQNQAGKVLFHQVEHWRDKLISQKDAALQEFLGLYTEVDRQHLRQLIRKAQLDLSSGKNTGGGKSLFNYILGIIGAEDK